MGLWNYDGDFRREKMKIICNKEEFAGMLYTCYGNTYSGDGCTLCALKRACGCMEPTDDISPIVDVCEVEEE